jgi:hypothetical protein
VPVWSPEISNLVSLQVQSLVRFLLLLELRVNPRAHTSQISQFRTSFYSCAVSTCTLAALVCILHSSQGHKTPFQVQVDLRPQQVGLPSPSLSWSPNPNPEHTAWDDRVNTTNFTRQHDRPNSTFTTACGVCYSKSHLQLCVSSCHCLLALASL